MRKNRFFRMAIFAILGLGLILSGCNSENEPERVVPNMRESIELNTDTRSAANELKDFYVQFTTDAVKYAASQTDIDNVIVSPVSAAILLSMIANGVEADTQKEITDYLGVTDLSALNTLSNILLTELPKVDNQTDFGLANSIWINSTYATLTPAYTNLMKSDYMADVRYEKFNDDAKLLKKINDWCSDKTNGQIKTMPTQLSSDQLAILLNAMKFKGVWEEKTFLKENTTKETFHGASRVNDVEMMHSPHKDRYYAADDNFELFYFFFGNSAFYFTVVLPNENLSLTDANELLTTREIRKLQKEAVRCQLEVYLPKFKVNSKLKLDNVLTAGQLAGLKGTMAFNMFEPHQTGQIEFNQASSLDIDETGAIGASVSSGELIAYAPEIIPGGEYTVKVNRPFYFFIREISTGACILSGRISDL